MLTQAYNIKEIDFWHLNTKNVKDMSFLFQSLDKLTKIDFGNIDISKVTSIQVYFLDVKV